MDDETPWDRELAALVARREAAGGKPGVADPKLLLGRPGLELLEAMLRGELPFPPIAETLDFSLISVEAGKTVFQGTPQFKHYNPLGSVLHHGRQLATAEGRIAGPDGKIYAHGTTTCLVFEVPSR